jgi:hypothetical protein
VKGAAEIPPKLIASRATSKNFVSLNVANVHIPPVNNTTKQKNFFPLITSMKPCSPLIITLKDKYFISTLVLKNVALLLSFESS